MLPQIGLAEMLLLALLALIILGPKDFPLMMRRFGRWTGKLRAMAWEFRQSFDEIGRQAEMEELKKDIEALKKQTNLDDLQDELSQTSLDLQMGLQGSGATGEDDKSDASSDDTKAKADE